MNWYMVVLYLHLFSAVLLVGYALYWAIMVVSLRRVRPASEVSVLLETLALSRWPHVLVPFKYRLPLPLLGLVFVAVLLLTGAALTLSYGFTPLLVVKLLVFIILVGFQHMLLRKRNEWLVFSTFALVLMIVAVSALLVRNF